MIIISVFPSPSPFPASYSSSISPASPPFSLPRHLFFLPLLCPLPFLLSLACNFCFEDSTLTHMSARWFNSFFKTIWIYLSALLGLCCGAWALASCEKAQALHGLEACGFFCGWARALGTRGQQLQLAGSRCRISHCGTWLMGCPRAYEILPDQGSNWHHLDYNMDS